MASSPAIRSPLPESTTNEVLTPRQKVRALLARLDDSDTGSDQNERDNKVTTDQEVSVAPGLLSHVSDVSSASEDDLPVARKSRMAARLTGGNKENEKAVEDEPVSFPGLEQRDNAKKTLAVSSEALRNNEESEDELSRPAPRRRLLTKRRETSVSSAGPQDAEAAPDSPLFFPSPSAARQTSPAARQQASAERELPAESNITSNSKFLALVQKHRQARLEKEAAEIVKRAAGRKNGKKGSKSSEDKHGTSPVSSAEEDSDASNVVAADKFTQEARPTRKASKKAVEEMKRETQRMSRNMQLAHQSRTKKKITKESLLARFNFNLPESDQQLTKGNSSTNPSSEVGSDMELRKDQETPPTSPPREPSPDAKEIGQKDAMIHEEDAIEELVVEAPSLNSIGLEAGPSPGKGKERADGQRLSSTSEPMRVAAATDIPTFHANTQPARGKLSAKARLSELLSRRKQIEETGDEDLDIVTAKSDVRKYAAFEKLPKRKAKETASHLALRNLAHLPDSGRDKRSLMTTSEMDVSLRKAARAQARKERQQKIDELKAKGVVIQTAEERERDQQEVEDLVERARQEAAEIQKREKEAAKKDGTYVKDHMDDDESDEEDGDFEEDLEEANSSESEEEHEEGDDAEEEHIEDKTDGLVDDAADEAGSDEDGTDLEDDNMSIHSQEPQEADECQDEVHKTPAPRKSRRTFVVSDEEDDDLQPAAVDSPALPQPCKTPQSLPRSARKQIPGLHMSDDLPMGLSQAFAATMADSQTQDDDVQEQDSLEQIRDLPSPNLDLAPRLNRLDSLDMVSDSQPASQTQPLNISLSFSQVPESPTIQRAIPATQPTPSQVLFEPTQDEGYMFSPFHGSRFSETPQQPAPHSTVDTVIMPQDADASPIVQRKGRLRRGRMTEVDANADTTTNTAFDLMREAAKRKDEPAFDKAKSNARAVVDEAAEESDDEYAGLGGVSDDDVNDEENDDDRALIDHDTQVGQGDEAKLAGLFADRERKNDEAAVSKLLKDITTGALRRKRGVNDDLDLSDEEDAVARRREAKRREFAKMRRELLKDEAVGKIAEDKKKEAFLKSIEDREERSDDEDFEQPESAAEESQSHQPDGTADEAHESVDAAVKHKQPLKPASASQLNRLGSSVRGTATKKPATLAEIRDSVSFLIEEPDSQSALVDLGLVNSDSESEPEAYVDLNRHLNAVEADENASADDEDDLDDFIVNDDGQATDEDNTFKKPTLPSQTSTHGETDRFASRRTNRANVVNRLSLLRQTSSTSSTGSVSATTKMAFYATSSSTTTNFKAPSLLRRATTNSSLGSLSSENVSATGVSTRTERGHVSEEKEFVRKANGGVRNSVNYQRPSVKEERMSARAGVTKRTQKKKVGGGGGGGGFMTGLFRGDSWG